MIFIGILEYHYSSHQRPESGDFNFVSWTNNYEYSNGKYFPSDTVLYYSGQEKTQLSIPSMMILRS